MAGQFAGSGRENRVARSRRRAHPQVLQQVKVDERIRSAVVEALEPRRLLAADLVISEFLASNDHSITDSVGDHSDWIEIHNDGDADANLGDYYLSNDAGTPLKWHFPVQTLAAGGYLVVFADSKDQAVAGQELHTNFNLSASGDYRALMNAADGSPQFEYAPAYPSQTSDISYGLSDSDNPLSSRIYFPTPTPGVANAPTAAQPIFS